MFICAQDSGRVLLRPAEDPTEGVPDHHCVVAGRRADGRLTEAWSDARTRSDGRFVAYVPRCDCGWTGPPFSFTPSGYAACQRLWRDKHLESFLRAREPRTGRGRAGWAPKVIDGGALKPEV